MYRNTRVMSSENTTYSGSAEVVIQSCPNYDAFALFTVSALTKTILHIDKYNKCISKNLMFAKVLSVQIKSICANFFKWL